ncbi:MAG: uroporphyrinogen-III C-methyltransferase [Acidimicrobiia bacterium]|nr:uroporphyrinogen-III C-methyltransferase [Acidimicrobiia bacterium]
MSVALVGAGPGDPGLLTLRGAELLADAEAVVYDRLAAPALLDLAPPGAERIFVGKAPGDVAMTQDAINQTLVRLGAAGKRVVRLKGGDPFVFGRGGEEAQALERAGIEFEVVPGITSAISAPAYAGIPVTHRGLSTHVTVVTGHEDPAKERSDVDWEALAAAGGTLVILMGVARLEEIAARLLAAGRSGDTPLAAVARGTRPDQQTRRSTLGEVAEGGLPALSSPAVIVVGEVAALDLSWFEKRPLHGRTVVVTRAREQSSGLRRRLETLGARVVELPTIQIEDLPFELPELTGYAWIVFTSANGVSAFFERGLTASGLDARALAGSKVAAIGPGTADALAQRGVIVDVTPERFVAESLLEALPADGRGERVLIPRAEQARDVLPDGLAARGFGVDVLPVYRTTRAEPDAADLDAVRNGEVDCVTFTSSSTVWNFRDAIGDLGDVTPDVVSIGPVTSATAEQAGLPVTVEAAEHTIDGLVAAVCDLLGTKR